MNLPTYLSGVLFTKAHKLVRLRIYAVLEKHDLNPTLWSILGATTQAPEGIRLSSVAALLSVKAPLITTEAVTLIEQGLIRRIAHHSDGRAKLLVATAKGNKLAAKVEQELYLEINSLLDGLTPAEIATFQKTLQTIIENSARKA